MTEFLRQLWVFIRPYRGRFLLGLLCGLLYEDLVGYAQCKRYRKSKAIAKYGSY